jgi:hypothetical protein
MGEISLISWTAAADRPFADTRRTTSPFSRLCSPDRVAASHPLAFVALYVAPWPIRYRQSFGRQGAATVATSVMILFIQRARAPRYPSHPH